MADNPKLTVLYEKLRGKVFELNKDQMSIGRRDGNDIVIKDASLSGHHADILRVERDGRTVYILRDNDSTNGTRINNLPITEQELKNSDIILFGGVEVLFDSNDGAETQVGSTTVTIDISQLDSNTSTVPAHEQPRPVRGDGGQEERDVPAADARRVRAARGRDSRRDRVSDLLHHEYVIIEYAGVPGEGRMDAGSSGFTVLRRFSGGNRGPAGEERRRGRRKVSVSGPSDAGNGCPADCLYGMRRVASKRVFRNESEYMNMILNSPDQGPGGIWRRELRQWPARDDKPAASRREGVGSPRRTAAGCRSAQAGRLSSG